MHAYDRNIETKEEKEDGESDTAHTEQLIPNTEEAQIELAIANSLRDTESRNRVDRGFSSSSSSSVSLFSSRNDSDVLAVATTTTTAGTSTAPVAVAPVQAAILTEQQKKNHQDTALRKRGL